jgi:hypothetical protein
MKLLGSAVLATVTGIGTAHAGCVASLCPTGEQPIASQQATEDTVQRRIDNALKDLEVFNARAFAMDARLDGRIEHALNDLETATVSALKADQERLNEVARKAGIDR